MDSQQKRTSKASDQKEQLANRIGKNGRRIAQRAGPALRQLMDAYEYANELDRSAWDFAVEITVLRKLGLNNSDLRWLICRGYVAQGRELVPEGQQCRTVVPSDKLTFSRRTCFVALEGGLDFLRCVVAPAPVLDENSASTQAECSLGGAPSDGAWVAQFTKSDSCGANGHALRPQWSRDRQELSVGEQVVKQFKVPAPNQELILSVFQEEGWPIRIDDPLPPHPQQDPKRRLHDTINSLNRSQKASLIRFSGDGKGTGVRWELVHPNHARKRVNGRRA